MKMQPIVHTRRQKTDSNLPCCYNTSAQNNLQQSDTIKSEEVPRPASAFHLQSAAQPLTPENKQLFTQSGFSVGSDDDEASSKSLREQQFSPLATLCIPRFGQTKIGIYIIKIFDSFSYARSDRRILLRSRKKVVTMTCLGNDATIGAISGSRSGGRA